MKAYLLTFSPHDNSVSISGPYKSDEKAVRAGWKWQKQHNDSPCWQVLSHPTFDIEVRFGKP